MIENNNETNLEYSPETIDYFESFITETFGDIETVLHSLNSDEKIHIDICMVPPDEEFPYWKLVTVGLSQYKQNLPDSFKGAVSDRCEFVMLLEPEWTYDQSGVKSDNHVKPSIRVNKNADNNYLWPIMLLKNAATNLYEENSFTLPGDIFEFRGEESSSLNNLFIKPLKEFKTDFNCLTLPTGEEVEFYQVAFMNDEELNSLLPLPDISERIQKGELLDDILHPNRETIDLT